MAGENSRNIQLVSFEQAVSHIIAGGCNQSPALIDKAFASSAVGHFCFIGLRILSETFRIVEVFIWAVADALQRFERLTVRRIKLHTKVTNQPRPLDNVYPVSHKTKSLVCILIPIHSSNHP